MNAKDAIEEPVGARANDPLHQVFRTAMSEPLKECQILVMNKLRTSGPISALRIQRAFTPVLLLLIISAVGLGCQSSPGASEGGGPSGDVYYARFAIQVKTIALATV